MDKMDGKMVILNNVFDNANKLLRSNDKKTSHTFNIDDSISLSNDSKNSSSDWHNSNISVKLYSGFLIICVLTMMVGYLGFVATQQIEILFQAGVRLAEVESFTETYLIIAKEAATFVQNGIIVGVTMTIISSIGIAFWMLGSIRKIIVLEKKSFASDFRIKNERLLAMGALASRLSHDLRNPLMVVKGTLQIMKEHSKDADEQTIKRFSRLNTAVTNMTRLVEHMLNFVRTSKLDIRSNSVLEIIQSTINNINKPETIKINFPITDLKINCDFRMLEIVFMNLVLNAIQAIKEKGEITVRLKDGKRDVFIEVEDSGPGIPNSVLPNIFDPLFTTKVYGTGLGLASCKCIVEQHGGKILVTNNPTIFTIILPKKISAPQPKKMERHMVILHD